VAAQRRRARARLTSLLRWPVVAATLWLVAWPGRADAGAPAAPRPDFAATKGAPVPDRPDAIPDEILVRFKPARAQAAIDDLQARRKIRVVRSKELARIGWHRIKVAPGRPLKDAVEACRTSPDVLFAEPNYRVHALQGRRLPNDPRVGELWGMDNTGQTGGTADADIDAPEAWDMLATSTVVVAVIDTGVDASHPDLAANIWTNAGEVAGNGVDDDGNGFVDDVHGWDFAYGDNDPADGDGHGTHCAGTIGAVGNNGVGVAGVCWSVKIMPVKFLDDEGSGSISDAIEAIAYATRMGARVLSNSWGTNSYSQALGDAIDAADRQGALFVAAAGNDYGSDNDTAPHYPSNFDNPNVIAVAATTHDDGLAAFSNVGATNVDLGAPGQSILSTVPNGGYGSKSGTSMATPHVAGACALVWAAGGAIPHTEVKAAILQGVDVRPSLQGRCVTGGRLNLKNAMDIVAVGRRIVVTAPNGGEGIESGALATVTWSAFGSDWQAGDKVRIEHSANGGASWTAVAGAQSLNYDARSFAWDTTGLAAGTQYRIRVAFVGDPTVNDTSDANFAVTGAFHHFDVAMATPQPDGRRVQGACTVVPKDTAGRTITSFGDARTAGRFPVTLAAPGATIGGLGGGNQLSPGSFLGGIADLAALGMTVDVVSPPVTVKFAATSADGKTGQSGDVVIYAPPDYFTEQFDAAPFDLANRSILFIPDGSADHYAAFSRTITALPTDPAGGTVLALDDDDFAAVAIPGNSVPFYGTSRSTFYVGSNGYVTFGSGDQSYSEAVDVHFSLPRVAALFDDLDPSAGQVTWKALADRVAVTYSGVAEYDTTNSNTFQIELYFDGRIALSYLGMAARDGLAGLSRGTGLPADFLESDLSAYPPLSGRYLSIAAPNGGEGIEAGTSVAIVWTAYGTNWQASDTVRLEYSSDGGATWSPVAGAGKLAYDAGSFTWDTAGLPRGNAYRVRAVYHDDASIRDASDGNFAVTGPFHHFEVAIASPQANGQPVSGACQVTARDAWSTTITSFGASNTTGRFPVTLAAPGVTVSGLGVGGNRLEAADFASGSADLAALGMTVAVASTPVTVQFTATSADGKSGTSANVVIEGRRDYFTENFDTTAIDLARLSVIFVPDGSGNHYAAYTQLITALPTSPAGGTPLSLGDDDFAAVTLTGASVKLYGVSHSTFYVGSNGYITFGSGDDEYVETVTDHFRLPRISALFDDLSPDPGQVTWRQLPDRVAVTFLGVSEFFGDNSNTFQIELYFDGRIVLSYLGIDSVDGLAGLSRGTGRPADFAPSDLSAYPRLPGGPRQLHTFPLDTDPGWSRTGGWAFGRPTGQGSDFGDPTSGYTGTNVYGYNLNGDYPDDLSATAYLTTTAIDCTGATGVVLRFRRWLGVEDGQYDRASIQISNDGSTWTPIWENPDDATISDSEWSLQTVDISAFANNQPTVYIRWGMGPTDYSVTYPGWNIDDIEILGKSAIHVDDSNTTGIEHGTLAHPFNTIQEAVNAAGNGDTIKVARGTYRENVTISGKAVHIQGGYRGGAYPGIGDFSEAKRDPDPSTNGTVIDGAGTARQILCQGSAARGSIVSGLGTRARGTVVRGGAVLRRVTARH